MKAPVARYHVPFFPLSATPVRYRANADVSAASGTAAKDVTALASVSSWNQGYGSPEEPDNFNS